MPSGACRVRVPAPPPSGRGPPEERRALAPPAAAAAMPPSSPWRARPAAALLPALVGALLLWFPPAAVPGAPLVPMLLPLLVARVAAARTPRAEARAMLAEAARKTAGVAAAAVLLGLPLTRLRERETWAWIAGLAAATCATWPAEEEGPARWLPGAGAVVGAWAGVAALPLDWGTKWQEYPTPIVRGTVLGHAAGAAALCALAAWQRGKRKAL